ncbi:MAG: prolipoprotein diacylglyceryl transferase [Rickettsiaceae bacterium]|nr:MAG: prolipoprotein diacylglyceryl transferase [Rickettsiaceae bacterium]
MILRDIDPNVISIGPLSIKWYSLAYIFGILFGWFYASKIVEKYNLSITKKNLEDFVTWSVVSIIIGGRLGYVLFYNLTKYLAHPIDILKIYEGGQSFHGGLVGLIIALILFCKKYKIDTLKMMDLIAVVAPFGLLLGRIANFINGELYGRMTDVSWAVVFLDTDLHVPALPRHPSQLYEAIANGLILFAIMFYLVFYKKALTFKGRTSAIFILYYSVIRILLENFRQPDPQVGLFWNYVTMGQILSLPMLLIGAYLLVKSSKCQLTQTSENI